MNITFNNKTCTDGWVVVDNDQLAGEAAMNWHIVEEKLDDANVVTLRVTKVFCGESLKSDIHWDRSYHVFRNDFEGRNALRDDDEMARLQNIDEEFCGRCAAHLYVG